MAQRARSSRSRERQWNERVLGLITAAALIAALLAFSQGSDWVDATKRVDYWMSVAGTAASMNGLAAGAIIGLVGLLLLAVPAAVIGASPLRGRLTGLGLLIGAVTIALAAGSGYAVLVRYPQPKLLEFALGVAATLAEVAIVALVGYRVGRVMRRGQA